MNLTTILKSFKIRSFLGLRPGQNRSNELAAGDFLDPEFELGEEVLVEVARPVPAAVD